MAQCKKNEKAKKEQALNQKDAKQKCKASKK